MDVIKDRYGSLWGLVRHLYFSFALRGESLRALNAVDLRRVERLVFVCRGNVCRSPFCEYAARSLGCEAVSFGLKCNFANPARERIQLAAQGFGIALDAHRSTDIKHYRPRASDLVVVTEPQHVLAVRSHLGEAQLTLLGLWTKPRKFYIHDPYSATPHYCARCTALMYSGVERLSAAIREAKAASLAAPVAPG